MRRSRTPVVLAVGLRDVAAEGGREDQEVHGDGQDERGRYAGLDLRLGLRPFFLLLAEHFADMTLAPADRHRRALDERVRDGVVVVVGVRDEWFNRGGSLRPGVVVARGGLGHGLGRGRGTGDDHDGVSGLTTRASNQ